MIPTEETFGACRFYECPKCKARYLWHEDPAMDGSYSEKHKDKKKGYISGLSLLSDPETGVFGEPRYPPPPGPNDPKRKRIDGKSFRWHEGKERWVLWK